MRYKRRSVLIQIYSVDGIGNEGASIEQFTIELYKSLLTSSTTIYRTIMSKLLLS